MFNSNPVLSDKVLETVNDFEKTDRITVYGTLLKTFLLFLCAAVPFAAIWTQVTNGFLDKSYLYAGCGAIVSFILAFLIYTSPQLAKFLAPVYAFGEGLFLGAVSAILELQFKGIAFYAIFLTFLCMLCVLFLYCSRLIRNTAKFQKVIFVSMLAIFGFYLFNILGYFFHFTIPMLYTSDAWGLGFSIFVVVIASLSFISDFDCIERAVVYCYPKSSEWFFAFGLMVGLVWLYLEMLSLLSKLYRR